MKKVVGAYTSKKIGPTFFQGKLPMDGIWATPNVIIANACIMPAGYGIGDHRLFVINIHTSLLIGTGSPRVQRAASRRLNTRLPHVTAKYSKNLEENIWRHHLIEKVGEAHTQGTSKEDTQQRIIIVDKEGKQYMTHAECISQKMKSGRICFSPKLVIWIKREQIYHSLEWNTSWVEIKTGGILREQLASKRLRAPFKSPRHNSRFTWRFARNGIITFEKMGLHIARNTCRKGQGRLRKKAGRRQQNKSWT
jgi:hypothetical protein